MNKFRSALVTGKGLHSDNPLVTDKQAQGAQRNEIASVAVQRNETRLTDHRDGDRNRLAGENVTATHNGKAYDAELINLSGGGAMIRADLLPRLWDRVDLSLGEGGAIECAVRWIRGDRIGLEFAHETRIESDPALRDAILLDTIRRSFPDVDVPPAAGPTKAGAETASTCGLPADITPRERRHPLIWSGQLLYNHDAHPVRLRNISATGALVECAHPLEEGIEVMLDLGNSVTEFATVSWVRGDQAGLCFEGTFDLSRLATANPEVAPQNWARPGFLDLVQAQDSPWAEEWQRPTLDKLRNDLENYLRHKTEGR